MAITAASRQPRRQKSNQVTQVHQENKHLTGVCTTVCTLIVCHSQPFVIFIIKSG